MQTSDFIDIDSMPAGILRKELVPRFSPNALKTMERRRRNVIADLCYNESPGSDGCYIRLWNEILEDDPKTPGIVASLGIINPTKISLSQKVGNKTDSHYMHFGPLLYAAQIQKYRALISLLSNYDKRNLPEDDNNEWVSRILLAKLLESPALADPQDSKLILEALDLYYDIWPTKPVAPYEHPLITLSENITALKTIPESVIRHILLNLYDAGYRSDDQVKSYLRETDEFEMISVSDVIIAQNNNDLQTLQSGRAYTKVLQTNIQLREHYLDLLNELNSLYSAYNF